MAKETGVGKIAAGVVAGCLAVGAIAGAGYAIYDAVKAEEKPAIEEEVKDPAKDEEGTEQTPEDQVATESVANAMNLLGY